MEENKKKSKVLLFVIIGIVVALLVGLLIFFLVRKESSSIENLEKAINNTVDVSKNSATVKASIEISGDDTSAISMSGTFKYQKNNDEHLFSVETNPSLFAPTIKIYGSIKDKSLILYTNNTIVNTLTSNMSDKEVWLYNKTDLNEYLEEMKIDENAYSKDVSFKDLGLDKYIKYVDREDGYNHYELAINKKLIESLKKKLPKEAMSQYNDMLDSFDEMSEVLEEGYVINFYTKNNKLQKITMDLSKMMEESGIKKALITVEFLDFGKTQVNIPKEAKASTKTIEEYMSENLVNNSDIDFDDTDDLDDQYDQDDLDDFEF